MKDEKKPETETQTAPPPPEPKKKWWKRALESINNAAGEAFANRQ